MSEMTSKESSRSYPAGALVFLYDLEIDPRMGMPSWDDSERSLSSMFANMLNSMTMATE